MWTNKYIGIPYKDGGDDENGLDCWGLVRIVYKNEFNIELPSFKQIRLDTYNIRSTVINEHKKDGWTEITEPISGAVVLVRVKGLPIHTGVMIDNTKFLNILPGANCVIADITNPRWQNKIIGFYKYTPDNNSVILTGMPHPLKSQVYTKPVMAGHTLTEIYNIIINTYKVPKPLIDRIIITVNGRPIDKEQWNNFILVNGDRIEYRVRAGLEQLIAEIFIYLVTGTSYVGALEAGMTAVQYATTYLGASSIGLTVASAGVTVLGSMAITAALAPPRPTIPSNPGTSEQQLILTGSPNQLLRHGTIPIVLGKMKISPPLGGINIIDYGGTDERDSYLSMLLTWGYGPLKLYNWNPSSFTNNNAVYKWDGSTLGAHNSGLKLGNIILDNYTVDAISHLNIYDKDYFPGSSANKSAENETSFKSVYGNDRNQIFLNQVIHNDKHPLDGTGSVPNPPSITAALPSLSGPLSGGYTSLEIALHFPEGLRKVRIKGDNSGKSYSLIEGVPDFGTTTVRNTHVKTISPSIDVTNGSIIPLILKFEYRLGGTGTDPYYPLIVRDQFGNKTDNKGIIVLGTTPHKDAFTRVYTADAFLHQFMGSLFVEPTAPAGTHRPELGLIEVRITRLTGEKSEAPLENTAEYTAWSTANTSNKCVLVQTFFDNESIIVNTTDQPAFTSEGACLANNTSTLPLTDQYQWIRNEANNSDGSVKLAENWRLYHTVVFLSLTGKRYRDALDPIIVMDDYIPEKVPLAHTTIKLASSQQLNGQLEAINGIVQTLGREYTGTNTDIIDLTKWVALTPINNPASLFLHVLTSPANPKRIRWSHKISLKIDLVKIQKWWKYCNEKGFTYNQVIAQAKSIVDVLKDIAAAGRASPAQIDGKWTVQIDERKDTIVQMFTPHNSWGFNSVRNLERIPDGLRVNFYNEDKDYQEDELIVYNKGKSETNATLFESINFSGITKASLVEDHAKWHMAQAIVRRELYTLNTDLEYLICNRGDRVTVTHDVPKWGYGSGRISRRGTISGGNVKVIELDDPVILDPTKSYGIKIRSSSFPTEVVERQILVNNIEYDSISRASDGLTVTITITSDWVPFVVGDRLKITSNTHGSGFTTSNEVIVTSVQDTIPSSFTYIHSGAPNISDASGKIHLLNGLYKRIKFSVPVGTYTGKMKDGVTPAPTVNLAEEGDLFLFGEYQKISNDLIVLTVEPDSNKGAKLTLIDYAYESLFDTSSGMPAYLSQTENLIFRPNISDRNDLAGFTAFDYAPEIGQPVTDLENDGINSGSNYSYRIKLPYANKSSSQSYAPVDITHVECQYGLNHADAVQKSIKVNWLSLTVYISDVQIGETYKMRLRYVKKDGKVGIWSSERLYTVVAIQTNYSGLNSIKAYLSGTDLVVVPDMPNNPPNFKWFEVRIWKDPVPLNTDFWDYSTNHLIRDNKSIDTKIFRILQSPDPAGLKTDLKTFGDLNIIDSIISKTGVRYKIACRTWDGQNYNNNSALATWHGKTISPGTHFITPSMASLNFRVVPLGSDKIARSDLWGMRVWMSKPNINYSTGAVITLADPNFVPSDSNQVFMGERLSTTINNLIVDREHYFRYALISSIDPKSLDISNAIKFIPKNSILATTSFLPPTPLGITAVAAITSIIVTLPSQPSVPGRQSIDYNFSDYPSGSFEFINASSSHKSTVVYGKVMVSHYQPVTFTDVANSILGEFEEQTIFTLPADPGTIYALFFKYKNKGGKLSSGAEGPIRVETGINVQKFLDMFAGQITEGQLFKGLQKEIGNNRIPTVDSTEGQLTVKIDNGGHVAGFGLSNYPRNTKQDSQGNTSKVLEDGSPFSEFGVVADRFWISAPAIMSDTAPTTGNFHGRRWIDTSNKGVNVGNILGVTAIYDTYKPNIHNNIIFENDPAFWYWRLYTKTNLEKLVFSGTTYVDKGSWEVDKSYAVNDYILDKAGNVYYLCIKAYNPVKISNFGVVNPKVVGAFTGSVAGTTFSVAKTVYVFGKELLPRTPAEETAAGSAPDYKMNPNYNSAGTFYYITSITTGLSGPEFVLSLEKNGKGVVTGIKPYVQYYVIPLKENPSYNLLANPPVTQQYIQEPGRWVNESTWQQGGASDLFPFIVETGERAGVRPGVYMNSAFIRDASITNAKIADASIDTAKIASLNASVIKAGKLDATVITAGSISASQIDFGSLRGKFNDSWTVVSKTLNLAPRQQSFDLPPGDYELILTASFGRRDERIIAHPKTGHSPTKIPGTTTDLAKDDIYKLSGGIRKEEIGFISAEVVGFPSSFVKAFGYWSKVVEPADLIYEIEDDPDIIGTNGIAELEKDTGEITDPPSITLSGSPVNSASASGGKIELDSKKIKFNSKKIRVIRAEGIRYDVTMQGISSSNFVIASPGGHYILKINSPWYGTDLALNSGPGFELTTNNVDDQGKWYHLGSSAVLNFLGNPSPVVITFTTQPTSVDEGAEAVFEFTVQELEKRSILQWSLEHVGTVSRDFHYVRDENYGIQGAVVLDSGNPPKGIIKIKTLETETTNLPGTDKKFKINIKRNEIVVGSSNTITVNNTSKAPTYSLSLSPLTVAEGGIVTGTVTAINPRKQGDLITWALADVSTPYDNNAGKYFDTWGSVTIDAYGAGSFNINIREDNANNNTPKSFKVMIYSFPALSPLLSLPVGPVNVDDTSKTPGINTVIAAGGSGLSGGDLNGKIFDAPSESLDVDSGYQVTIASDGRWLAMKYFINPVGSAFEIGKWFDPITPNIGSDFHVRITPRVITSIRGGYEIYVPFIGSTTSILDWKQLIDPISFSAKAFTYNCVDPLTQILINSNGDTKLAGELLVGDKVYTMHEFTKRWDDYNIINHKIVISPKVIVTFTDNTTLTASSSHKVFMGRDLWLHLFELTPGQCVVSCNGLLKQIKFIEEIGLGPVVSMEIYSAHTYVANDIISHNIKLPDCSAYSSEIEVDFDIDFSADGGLTTAQTATVKIKGQNGLLI